MMAVGQSRSGPSGFSWDTSRMSSCEQINMHVLLHHRRTAYPPVNVVSCRQQKPNNLISHHGLQT